MTSCFQQQPDHTPRLCMLSVDAAGPGSRCVGRDTPISTTWRAGTPSPAEGEPDNMLGLVHSRELSELPLGSNHSQGGAEGDPLHVSRSVRNGSIAGAAGRLRRSDCRRQGRCLKRRPGAPLRRLARGRSWPPSKPSARRPSAVSSQISPLRMTLCSCFRRLSSGLKLVRSIRPEKKRVLTSSKMAFEVIPLGASARTCRTASLMVGGRPRPSIAC